MRRTSIVGGIVMGAVAGVAGAVVLAAAPARAGVELTTELVMSGAATEQSLAPRAGRMLLDGDRVRMEMTPRAAADAAHVMIYRGDRDLVWSVDDKRRTYTEVDRGTVDRMRAQMRANLDKMPPGQRAAMQAMLAAGETKRERPTVTPTGRSDKVGGLACRELEISRAGKKESEVCVAEWQAAGISKGDLGAVGKLGAFQADVMGAGRGSGSDDVLELFDQLDGFPVRVRAFHAGQPRSELRIVKVEHKPLDAKLFDVPPGYVKRTVGAAVPQPQSAPSPGREPAP